jgi:hypothetical protein
MEHEVGESFGLPFSLLPSQIQPGLRCSRFLLGLGVDVPLRGRHHRRIGGQDLNCAGHIARMNQAKVIERTRLGKGQGYPVIGRSPWGSWGISESIPEVKKPAPS